MAKQIEVLRIEVAKLELKPGDTLLVKFPDKTPMRVVDEFKNAVKEVYGDDVHGLIFIGDVEFSVVHKEGA